MSAAFSAVFRTMPRKGVAARACLWPSAPPSYPEMLELREKQKSARAPAKSWRNYYRVYHVLNLGRLGIVFPGIHHGPDAFPSKEIAEHHALVFLRELNPPGRWLMDFVGSFPEGDRPN